MTIFTTPGAICMFVDNGHVMNVKASLNGEIGHLTTVILIQCELTLVRKVFGKSCLSYPELKRSCREGARESSLEYTFPELIEYTELVMKLPEKLLHLAHQNSRSRPSQITAHI
jgi:hypothetical protein